MKLSQDEETLLKVDNEDIQNGTFLIPASVKEIGNFAFEKCTSLIEILIPDTVTNIGVSAFIGCTNLVKIQLSQNVTTLMRGLFQQCESLTEMVIPDSVTLLHVGVFSFCTGLKKAKISVSITEISAQTFEYCPGITSFQIPNGVTKIGHRAFGDCQNLTQIILPTSMEKINKRAFEGCRSLNVIFVDSTKENDVERIRGLLPEALRERVSPLALEKDIADAQKTEYECILRDPSTNRLYLFEKFLPFGRDIYIHLNLLYPDDNRYYQKLCRQVTKLPLPTDQKSLDHYKGQLHEWVKEGLVVANSLRQKQIAAGDVKKKRSIQLQQYTSEHSLGVIDNAGIETIMSANDFLKSTLSNWLSNKTNMTPEELLKTLFAYFAASDAKGRRYNKKELQAYRLLENAVTPKRMSVPPTQEELAKAKSRRAQALKALLGEDEIQQLKGLSHYNKTQIEDWLNFAGDVWSDEKYTAGNLLHALRHVADSRMDNDTLQFLNKRLKLYVKASAMSRGALEQIREATDKPNPALIAERQASLSVDLKDAALDELTVLVDQCFPHTLPITSWLKGEGEFSHLSASTLLHTIFNLLIQRLHSLNQDHARKLFDFCVDHQLFSKDPQALATNLHWAIRVENVKAYDNQFYFVKRLIDQGVRCDIPVNDQLPLHLALHSYYTNALGLLEYILNNGKGVDIYAVNEKSGKNALQLAEALYTKHQHDHSVTYEKPYQLLSEFAKKVGRPEASANDMLDERKEVAPVELLENKQAIDPTTLLKEILFDGVAKELSPDQRRIALVEKVSKQWTARGNSPITKTDISLAMSDFLSTVKQDGFCAQLSLDDLSADVRKCLQNIMAYAVKLQVDKRIRPDQILPSKITALADLIRAVAGTGELNEESIQAQYDTFEKNDKNRGSGFYRVRTFFHNKRYDGFHLVKSTAGELVYDLMQALKKQANQNVPHHH